MEKKIEVLEGIVLTNQHRQKRILFWTKINAIGIVIGIFIKIVTYPL